MLWPALVLSATAGSQLTCSECAVVQEGIFNALKYNLSYYEQAAVVGTQETVTLEVGQVIWRMCESEPWKSVRYSETVEAACREFTRTHLDLATHEWKEKSADEYHDPALALRMKRKVCTLPDVDACSFDDMLDGYISPTDECALCEAIVHDLEKSVRTSRDAGAKPKSDPYFRLVAIMSQVCNELPMRHTIPKEARNNVLEACQDLWDEFEHVFLKLATRADSDFARGLCASELGLCAKPIEREAFKAEL